MTENNLELYYRRIKEVLTGNAYEVAEPKAIPYGLQFAVRGEAKGVLRLYSSKKNGIKVDYSQLREDSQALARLIETDATGLTARDMKNWFPIIGSDESGKGDYFGPLVSAAVYVDAATAALLAAMGVKDCKKLTDSRTLELAAKIMEACEGKYAVIEISPLRYNRLYEQFKQEGKNLNYLLAWAHAKAIGEILRQTPCPRVLADKFGDERLIAAKLQDKVKDIELIQLSGAEENIAVAAASILARARFLRKLSSIAAALGIDLPKGASQAVIAAGKELVRLHGQQALAAAAKLHFRTTQQVMTGME